MTQSRRLSHGISYLLKALLVLITPLSFSADSLIQLLVFRPSGFLFTPVYSYPAIMTEYTWIIYSGGILLRNFIIGMLIISPGILFSHELSKAPPEKNYWKRGLVTAAGIYLLSVTLMIWISLYLYNPITYTYDMVNYQLFENLRYFPSLVIGIFVLLPMVQRQAVIIGTPKSLHYYPMNELESNPKFSLSRERILSIIMWMFLCFGPYAVGLSIYYGYGMTFPSFLLLYNLQFSTMVRSAIFSLSIYWIDFSSFLIFALAFIFQFFFVREVYKYLRKEVSRQRLLSVAVLSLFSPLIIMNIISMFIGMYYYSLIPLPLLQAIGFVVIRYHKPKAEQIDKIWDDVPNRMWWEKKVERPIPVYTTPERPIRHHDEELITVPLPYIVLSKIRSLNHRESKER